MNSLERIRKVKQELADLNAKTAKGQIITGEEKAQLRSLAAAPVSARRDAARILTAIAGESFGSVGSTWVFMMHGRAEGESFHDRMLGGAQGNISFTNPITMVVVGDQRNQHMEFELTPGSSDLKSSEAERLDHLVAKVAKVAPWRVQQGMGLPHIRVTVESIRSEREFSDARAQRMEKSLRKRLDTVLQEQNGNRLKAADFEVTVRKADRDVQKVRDLFDDPTMEVNSRVVVDAFMEGNPAERARDDLTDRQLADLSREMGVHKADGRGGKLRGKFTPVSAVALGRMREIVRAGQFLEGYEGLPSRDRLIGIRRLADVLAHEYGHTGPFRLEHLDPLVRDVFGLHPDTPISLRHRAEAVGLVDKAKSRGTAVTVAALREAIAEPGPIAAVRQGGDTVLPSGGPQSQAAPTAESAATRRITLADQVSGPGQRTAVYYEGALDGLQDAPPVSEDPAEVDQQTVREERAWIVQLFGVPLATGSYWNGPAPRSGSCAACLIRWAPSCAILRRWPGMSCTWTGTSRSPTLTTESFCRTRWARRRS